jgi:hypothetical protein
MPSSSRAEGVQDCIDVGFGVETGEHATAA